MTRPALPPAFPIGARVAAGYRLAAAIVVLLAAVMLAAPARADGDGPPQLITNGDFKTGTAPWWGPGIGDNRLSRSDGRLHIKIKGGYAVHEHIPVRDDKRYLLSMMIRSADALDDTVFVQVSFRGEGVDPGWRGNIPIHLGDHDEPAVIVTGGDHDWTRFDAVIEVPKGADQMLVYLRKIERTPGIAQYAEVSLVETEEKPLDGDAAARRSAAAPLFGGAVDVADAAAVLDRQVAAASNGPHTIAEDGAAAMAIHLPPNPDFLIIGAAKALAGGLARITGGSFTPMSDDTRPRDGGLIVLGRDSAVASKLVPAADFDGLGEDGFIIRSVGPHLVIAGATSRGTMYGVNWFMDRTLGVRWYAPEVTVWPDEAPDLTVDRMDERQVPRFAYREVLASEAENKVWRAHNLLNGESHGPSYLSSPRTIDSWDRSWEAAGGTASFHELLPPSRYGVLHPAWFLGGQVAMMNPELRQAMADEIVARLKQLPDYRKVWYGVRDMDWGWDMDPASKAFADQHGGNPSAPRLDMMIDVATKVRAVLPDAKLAFNAYHWSFAPPEGMTVPDYLLVFPMTIQVDYRTPLNEGDNVELGRSLEGWNAIARHIVVWDHVTNFDGFVQPTPNIRAIAKSIKWLAGLENVRGYFAEGAWDTPAAEFTNLRAWMIARLLWNPDADVDELLKDFTAGYYGPAGDEVMDYIDLSEQAAEEAGLRLTEKLPVGAADFSLDFVQKADALFAKAAEAVRGTDYADRVREARMPLDYLVLARRAHYAALAEAAGSDWSVDETDRRERFWAAVEESGLRGARQGATVDALRAMLDVERIEPAAPPFSDALVSGEDYVDISDQEVILYDGTKIVGDRAASDAAAVRLDPNSRGWVAQVKLDRLPPEGEWRLFASVRARGGDGSDPAVQVGVYPPMTCSTTVTLPTGDDGSYRLVEFPGGPLRRTTDHNDGIYLHAASAPAAGEILVDRLVAVPTDSPLDLSRALSGEPPPGCATP